MKKLIVFLVVLLLAIAGIFLYRGGPDGMNAPEPTPEPTASPEQTASPGPAVTSSPAVTPTPVKTSKPAATQTPTPTAIPTSTPRQHTVNIKDFAFSSPSLTVKRGDTVLFVNQDSAFHTATDLNGAWSSGTLGTGATFELKTSTLAPGTYQYRCTIHPSMTATLTVNP